MPPAFARILADVDAAAVTSRAALARLPVTRKSELLDMQKARAAVRRLAATRLGRAATRARVRVAGPDLRARRRAARLLAAGAARCSPPASARATSCTTASRITSRPAGSMLETGAHALGCTVFPRRHRPDRAAGAGDGRPHARRLCRHAVVPEDHPREGRRAGRARCRRLRKALVSGEAFPPSLRDALAARGIAGYQVYATADLGTIAYEVRGARRPGRRRRRHRRDRAPGHRRSGGAGRSRRSRRHHAHQHRLSADPLRHRRPVGAAAAAQSPCGRTNMRIKGWMGRADQTTKVKGMFVHPSQVAAIVRRHPEIAKARLVVDNPDGNDRMTLHVEVAGKPAAGRGRDRRVDPRCHQAARRRRVSSAGRTPQRRQGHRRHPQVRLTAASEGTGEYSAISALIATARRRVRWRTMACMRET